MLNAILQLAAKRSMVTVDEVARELSVSAELAKELFVELERQGYLKCANSPCDTPCGGCVAKEACRFFQEPRLWTFTERGALTARRLSDKSAIDGAG
jgi:hypothetical protein